MCRGPSRTPVPTICKHPYENPRNPPFFFGYSYRNRSFYASNTVCGIRLDGCVQSRCFGKSSLNTNKTDTRGCLFCVYLRLKELMCEGAELLLLFFLGLLIFLCAVGA